MLKMAIVLVDDETGEPQKILLEEDLEKVVLDQWLGRWRLQRLLAIAEGRLRRRTVTLT